MKSKSLTGTTWSLLELAGLLEDEDTHVYYEKTKKHLGLHPFHLTNLSVALNDILRSNLNSYDSELQGFLLAYKNPKLLTALGDTFYDSCFIHVDIEADFYIFKPVVGHTMKGIVKKKGYNHIGVLVHKGFNVSIPRVLHPTEWPGDKLEIGQEVKFKITHIDRTDGLPFIRGVLNQENYLDGCRLFTKTTKGRKKNTTNESFYDRGNESDNSCDSKEENYLTLSQSKKLKELGKQVSPKKDSKKKRHFDDVNTSDEENKKRSKKRLKISQELNHSEYEIGNNVSYESSNDNVNNANNTDTDTSTKKKKRSEKISKKKSLESQISEPEFDHSNVTIKVEKDQTSNFDNESTVEVELKKHEMKSKRRSKKLTHTDSMNHATDYEEMQENVKSEPKRHSKKHKLLNSDINDSRIEIKVEELSESDNINEYPVDNHDVSQHKSSKKRIKKSVTDSESEIDNIRIKKEKNTSESEHTQEENDRKDKISKIIKTEQFESESSYSRNNSESENCLNGLPTKHKRKREKTPVIDFENVTIKEEKLDDNVNYGYDIEYESNKKKSPKKSKDIYIKLEKDKIKSESGEEGPREIKVIHEKIHKTSSKKHFKTEFTKNCQSDNSTTEESEETKHIFSPRKRSKKSKEPKYEVLLGDAEIKIERSSSVES